MAAQASRDQGNKVANLVLSEQSLDSCTLASRRPAIQIWHVSEAQLLDSLAVESFFAMPKSSRLPENLR
ncbi:hypothetical protein MASSI9I_51452 [Massilia sp. 9I]|nr:hypothetical protein MASSI9I_51452 [Massilia sp. 9I]